MLSQKQSGFLAHPVDRPVQENKDYINNGYQWIILLMPYVA